MRSRPPGLPDFRAPPVVEVAISIQFAPLIGFRTIHSGLLWQRFRDELPIVEEHGPLNLQFETFGPARHLPPVPQLQILGAFPIPRYWFLAADRSEVFQIQQDRVVFNWRRVAPAAQYPRYEALREKFESYLTRLEEFIKEGALGEIRPNQSEITYINRIGIQDNPSGDHFRRIFNHWNADDFASGLPEIEDESFQVRCVLKHPDGHPEGRLYITASRGPMTRDLEPAIYLNLVARGKPRSEDLAGALGFLDAGRVSIVTSFAAITRPEMHAEWGRTDESQ